MIMLFRGYTGGGATPQLLFLIAVSVLPRDLNSREVYRGKAELTGKDTCFVADARSERAPVISRLGRMEKRK